MKALAQEELLDGRSGSPPGPSRAFADLSSEADLVAVPDFREVRAGLHSMPFLADHGFHDMIVLPGSFYIELARRVHEEIFRAEALSLRDIVFERPVILAADDVAITVRIQKREPGRVTYEFFDAPCDEIRHSANREPCARMQVDLGGARHSKTVDTPHIGDRLTPPSLSGSPMSGTDFYRDLRGNGNQYGLAFQVFTDIRRSDRQASGLLAKQTAPSTGEPVTLSPALIDAAPQLLSALTIERGQTFILKSIDRLVVNSLSGPAPWSARAFRTDDREAAQSDLEGAVQIVAADGSCLWEVSGVTLAFLDRPASTDASARGELHVCVASTFTAEPLEDSLRFWGEQFSEPLRIDFAPYNQVFQQLLDPASALRRNSDGINLVVLGMEDWLSPDEQLLRSPTPDVAAAHFGERARTILPNGLGIVHLNQYETDYVYQEIFEDRSYLRHDIRIEDGDTVMDIGANIGLFSLFVMSRCKDPTIYACEPSPRVFDLLQANCAAYGNPARVHVFNCGVAEKKGAAQFTFYEHSSVFSSFHPDEGEDRAAIQSVVRNVLENELAPGDVRDSDVEDLTQQRLRSETIECQLISISDIIRENGIERIQLLKIDAEKSELEILRGIEEEHWPLIEQIVMEVHDRSRAAVEEIEKQLTGRGFHCSVVEEKLLEDSGLYNIYATRRPPAKQNVNAAAKGLLRKVDEFASALETFVEATTAPLVLAIAPRSPAAEAASKAALDAGEESLIARASRHSQVRTISSQAILARYAASSFHDSHTRQLGHIPYTPEGYAAIGTALFRALHGLVRPPVKVIALDCDNTLWQGQCGEDGAAGVLISAPFRELQEFMVRQAQAGVLLALCSKNSEADVMAVFEQRPEMPLRREHLAAWQINWAPKADSLRALAARLNLGLESFVFLDDNPIECAAVRSSSPEVTVLELPTETANIPAFLEGVWVFDRATATSEDRDRSQWYQANSAREEQRAAAPTLRDFLNGLELRIKVSEATDEQLERVSQLTFRTNQFNLTTIRRSEAEIRALLKGGARCLATSVSDRFGDYGLVGVILYSAGADRCIIDTMLLSCRALGKGVEHRMLAELAGRAVREQKSIIEIPFRATDRNEPARHFLAQLGAKASPGGRSEFGLEFPPSDLVNLHYSPEERITPAAGKDTGAPQRKPVGGRGALRAVNLSAVMQRIGEEFNSIDAIVRSIESTRQSAGPDFSPATPNSIAGGSATEQMLAAIWGKSLGRRQVGFDENFFEAGGNSLKAVAVIAMIRRELKRDVSVVTLFECPTIKLLAARLDGNEGGCGPQQSAVADAGSRGRQRRNKIVKRRSA